MMKSQINHRINVLSMSHPLKRKFHRDRETQRKSRKGALGLEMDLNSAR